MFNKTVDSVTKTFTKAISDLQLIKEKRKEEVGILEMKVNVAQNEADHAERVLSKLEGIIS